MRIYINQSLVILYCRLQSVSLLNPLNLLLSPLGPGLKGGGDVFVFDKGGHCVVASR